MGDPTSVRGRKVRLEDIARMCGVSMSTASRAIAGEKGVRPEIRQRVFEAVRATNYPIPTRVTGKTVMVAASSAAMVDYTRNQFTLYVLEGLTQRAKALGIDLRIKPIADRGQELTALEEARRDDNVAGMLFLTLDDDEILTAARGFEKPIVLVNGDDPAMEFSSVTPANYFAAQLATRHLIARGHKRILFLTRPGRRTIGRRQDGWRAALAEIGVGANDLVEEVTDWLPDLARQAVAERIVGRRDFTAIVAAGDSLALGALEAVRSAGLSVPDDVAIVGIDDLPQSAFSAPPLTSVEIPKQDIGYVAFDLLHEEITLRPRLKKHIELGCHLTVRAST